MAALFITSITENAGKTMLSAGLGKSWLDIGKKVGYIKLQESGEPNQPTGADKDSAFILKLFNLTDTTEGSHPTLNTTGDKDSLKSSFAAISQGKDMVIIEGLLSDISVDFLDTVGAKVLVVHDYSSPLAGAIPAYKKLGDRLLGVVVNKVPKNKIERLKDPYIDELNQAGIKLLGIIPEDRILMTLSIADLAEALQGKILNNEENSTELIENFMMGSSTFDRGPAYYSRKNNKAVILWGERPGFRKAALASLALAALQTSTRCIVISHNGQPVPAATQKAGEQKVPLISAPGTVPELISALEKGMINLKFSQEKKLPRLLEILGQNLNLKHFSQDLGITASQ